VRFGVIPPGRYSVLAQVAGSAPSQREITLEAGEARLLELVFP
jgi:hypothetical protein